ASLEMEPGLFALVFLADPTGRSGGGGSGGGPRRRPAADHPSPTARVTERRMSPAAPHDTSASMPGRTGWMPVLVPVEMISPALRPRPRADRQLAAKTSAPSGPPGTFAALPSPTVAPSTTTRVASASSGVSRQPPTGGPRMMPALLPKPLMTAAGPRSLMA